MCKKEEVINSLRKDNAKLKRSLLFADDALLEVTTELSNVCEILGDLQRTISAKREVWVGGTIRHLGE